MSSDTDRSWNWPDQEVSQLRYKKKSGPDPNFENNKSGSKPREKKQETDPTLQSKPDQTG